MVVHTTYTVHQHVHIHDHQDEKKEVKTYTIPAGRPRRYLHADGIGIMSHINTSSSPLFPLIPILCPSTCMELF